MDPCIYASPLSACRKIRCLLATRFIGLGVSRQRRLVDFETGQEPSTFPSCVQPLGWGGSFHRAERVDRERFAASLDRGDCCGTAYGRAAQPYEHTRPLARIPAQLPLTTMVAVLRMVDHVDSLR